MAAALINHTSTPAQTTITPSVGVITPRSRLVAFTTTMVGSIVLVWVAVAALVMYLADTTTLGAVGVGGFAAFWLGGGFGAIFGSAAAFGRDH